jgi:Kelch motif protein
VRLSVAAVTVVVAACSAPHRNLTLAPTLPPCLGGATVNSVRVEALGDFPLEATLTAAASPSAPAALDLPRATRVVAVEGFGPTGLAAFGRTAPLVLDDVKGGTLGIAYGPPDGLCATDNMKVARSGHRLTTLGSGMVLATGGDQVVEIYDPATAKWTMLTPPLRSDQVAAQAATALADGGALVTGGASADRQVVTPAATRFDGVGRRVGADRLLLLGRAGHSATALADGRVFVAGGCTAFAGAACNSVTATTEIYDPQSDSFAVGPPLLSPRWDHDAVRRGDGTVLLVGGRDATGATPPTEVVDPDEFRSFAAGVIAGRAAPLATGSVLLVGSASASLWLAPGEPALPLTAPATLASAPTLTALDDGGVLVAGDGLVVFDGRSALTTLATPFPRHAQAAARLGDGTVLLAGGLDGSGAPSTSAALYFRSPLSAWSSLPPLTLEGPNDPYLPRRADRAAAAAGRLVVSAPSPSSDGRPAEFALVAGMQVADFGLDLLTGRRGAASSAALLVAWQSEAAFHFVVVEPGRAVELWTVSAPRPGQTLAAPVAGCSGATLDAAALPDGDLAPLHVDWRGGIFAVSAGARSLLRCRPSPALPRGRVGVGARAGTVAFGNLALVR